MSKRKRKNRVDAEFNRMMIEMIKQHMETVEKYRQIKERLGVSPGASLRIRMPITYTIHSEEQC